MKKTHILAIILYLITTPNHAMDITPSSSWKPLSQDNIKKIMACSDIQSQKSLHCTCHEISQIKNKDLIYHSPLIINRRDHMQFMIQAAQTNDPILMHNLIDNMFNCNHADALDTITLFHKTRDEFHLIDSQVMDLYKGDKAIMEHYICTKYNNTLNQEDIVKCKITPLQVAARTSNIHMVELLLMLDENTVNEDDANGKTPLYFATNIEIAQLLLGCKNIVLNKRTKKGKTSLYKAVHKENKQLIDLFISQPNFIINEEDDKQLTPLHTAAEYGHDKAFYFFFKQINSPLRNPLKPIHLASAHGHYNIVLRILNDDPSQVNIQNSIGETALMLASTYNHALIVHLLLARQADVNSKDKHGISPLWIASQNGCTQTAQLLIRANASINAINNGKVTALWKAAQNGHDTIVDLLLKNNAFIDHAEDEGITSLMMASQRGYTDVVKILLASGANALLATHKGITAFDVAGNDEIKELLHCFSFKTK